MKVPQTIAPSGEPLPEVDDNFIAMAAAEVYEHTAASEPTKEEAAWLPKAQ